jgi:hypothetical protein
MQHQNPRIIYHHFNDVYLLEIHRKASHMGVDEQHPQPRDDHQYLEVGPADGSWMTALPGLTSYFSLVADRIGAETVEYAAPLL